MAAKKKAVKQAATVAAVAPFAVGDVVRVVAEGKHEGRRGTVMDVSASGAVVKLNSAATFRPSVAVDHADIVKA